MKMVVLVWAEVTPKTVKNCFTKAGFSEIAENDKIHVSNDPFAAWEDFIKQLDLLEESFKDLAVGDVASFDDDLAATQPPTSDEDILADILETEEDQLEADDSDPLEILEKPSSSQVHGVTDVLINFGIAIRNVELQALTVKASKFVEVNLASTVTQKKITNFFASSL